MSVSLINFPVAAIVDALLSYIQHLFSVPELTPSDYRWSSDDRKSKIRIGGPFVIDNEKPMSAPFIVVERGGYQFDDRIIDNLKSGNANVQTKNQSVSICDGYVNVICGSRVASEASTIANFISMMIQADRHEIIKNIDFLRNLKQIDIGPEIPVIKDTEIRRWEVTARFSTSLQLGWITGESSIKLWKQAEFINDNPTNKDDPFSSSGSITKDSDLLVDTTKDFGPYLINNPQLLEQELEKGWYYIRFKDNSSFQLYNIITIKDNHTLQLTTHDINDITVPWIASETKTGVAYDLLWNQLHLHTKIKVT
jgi:hypothetical protein